MQRLRASFNRLVSGSDRTAKPSKVAEEKRTTENARLVARALSYSADSRLPLDISGCMVHVESMDVASLMMKVSVDRPEPRLQALKPKSVESLVGKTVYEFDLHDGAFEMPDPLTLLIR